MSNTGKSVEEGEIKRIGRILVKDIQAIMKKFINNFEIYKIFEVIHMEKFFLGLTFLAIAFCLIVAPLVGVISLLSGVEQFFGFWVAALACMAIDIIIIAYRITGQKMNDNNRERMKKIRTAVNVITIVVAVCLLPGAWLISEDGRKANRKKDSYDYNSYDSSYSSYDSESYGSSSGSGSSSSSTGSFGSSGSKTESEKKCSYSGCDNRTTSEYYCYKHRCHKSGCEKIIYKETLYCSEHQSEGYYKEKARKEREKNKPEDEYGVNDYSDAEDFYYDNYDDFDGYEDAEDYYNEYAE